MPGTPTGSDRRDLRSLAWTALFLSLPPLILVGVPSRAQAPQPDPVTVPLTTLALMTEVVGPAANPIWEGGYAPELDDSDWQEMGRAASQLAASATALSLGGSDAAAQGWTASPAWQAWARRMADLAVAARNGAIARDQAVVAAAGDALVEVCEGCHMDFMR